MKPSIGYANPVLNNSWAVADTSVFGNGGAAFCTASNVAAMGAVAPAYSFVTSFDQSLKIFSGQCNRVSTYIYGQLEQVDLSNDDQNETVVDGIAGLIDLMGEPASCTAVLEAHLLKDNASMLEPLLLGIASASHKESEASRVQVLQRFAKDSNYRVKRAAVRALGRMSTPAAKRALSDISHETSGEIGLLAASSLR